MHVPFSETRQQNANYLFKKKIRSESSLGGTTVWCAMIVQRCQAPYKKVEAWDGQGGVPRAILFVARKAKSIVCVLVYINLTTSRARDRPLAYVTESSGFIQRCLPLEPSARTRR